MRNSSQPPHARRAIQHLEVSNALFVGQVRRPKLGFTQVREDIESVRSPRCDERLRERSTEHPVEVIKPVVEHRFRQGRLQRRDLLDELSGGVQRVGLLSLVCLPRTRTLGVSTVAVITVVAISGFGRPPFLSWPELRTAEAPPP
jgi:hypothetical protein